jgi:hypothetical protein
MAKQTKKAAGDKPKRGRPSNAEKAARAAAEQPKPEPQPPSESGARGAMKLPTQGTITGIVKELKSLVTRSGKITKEKRELIAKAEETKHVDKVALGWALSLLKKYEKKPAQFGVSFNHFLSYLDDLGLPKLADEALGMDLGESDDSQADLEEAIADAPRVGLSIVPGPNAPSEVPAAPDESEAA